MRFNVAKRGYHPAESVQSPLPFDHVAIDLTASDLPTSASCNNYLLVLLDICTGFVVIRALPDKEQAALRNTHSSMPAYIRTYMEAQQSPETANGATVQQCDDPGAGWMLEQD